MEFISPNNAELFGRLFVALLLGLVIGVERLHAHKTASMRTYAMASMGSALFVVISVSVLASGDFPNADPMRLAAQIVAGIGFLGAGMVIFKDNKVVTGITTATGLWVSAGVGIASGFGLYFIAIVSTILILFIFSVLSFIENRLRKIEFFEQNPEKEEIS